MNYIELAKTGNVGFVVKGIHYPDIRNFDLNLEGQLRIEYLELGTVGNGVKFNLGAVFNMLQHNLDYIIVYLDSRSPHHESNIEWLINKEAEGVKVYVYDKSGSMISITDD